MIILLYKKQANAEASACEKLFYSAALDFLCCITRNTPPQSTIAAASIVAGRSYLSFQKKPHPAKISIASTDTMISSIMPRVFLLSFHISGALTLYIRVRSAGSIF